MKNTKKKSPVSAKPKADRYADIIARTLEAVSVAHRAIDALPSSNYKRLAMEWLNDAVEKP